MRLFSTLALGLILMGANPALAEDWAAKAGKHSVEIEDFELFLPNFQFLPLPIALDLEKGL